MSVNQKKSGQDFLVKISQSRFRVDLLVAEMIQQDPEQRPDMKTVLKRISEWKPSEEYLTKYSNKSQERLFDSFIIKFTIIAFILTAVLMFFLSLFETNVTS